MEPTALTRHGSGAGEGPAVALRSMYAMMLRIRLFEERVADLVEAGEIKTPCHLYIGQEAIAVGVCVALDRTTPSGAATGPTGTISRKVGTSRR